ncbi:hypothetical protein D3C72_1193910 [compost metagenome]
MQGLGTGRHAVVVDPATSQLAQRAQIFQAIPGQAATAEALENLGARVVLLDQLERFALRIAHLTLLAQDLQLQPSQRQQHVGQIVKIKRCRRRADALHIDHAHALTGAQVRRVDQAQHPTGIASLLVAAQRLKKRHERFLAGVPARQCGPW